MIPTLSHHTCQQVLLYCVDFTHWPPPSWGHERLLSGENNLPGVWALNNMKCLNHTGVNWPIHSSLKDSVKSEAGSLMSTARVVNALRMAHTLFKLQTVIRANQCCFSSPKHNANKWRCIWGEREVGDWEDWYRTGGRRDRGRFEDRSPSPATSPPKPAHRMTRSACHLPSLTQFIKAIHQYFILLIGKLNICHLPSCLHRGHMICTLTVQSPGLYVSCLIPRRKDKHDMGELRHIIESSFG